VNKFRRVASALLALGLALGAFSASPAPARAESENAGELGAVIFAFDFSRSVYCTYEGATPENCTTIGPDLAAAVQGLANDVAANSETYTERKVTFQVVEFGTEAFVVRTLSGECKGNTGDPGGTALLVSCLEQVASDYSLPDSPRAELYDTFYGPPLRIVREIERGRCGIILFTDGKPKDPTKAKKLAEKLKCAVLPVSTGDKEAIDVDFLEEITKPTLVASAGCAQSGSFSWPYVYFPTAEEAVTAIGDALDRVACPPRVPAVLKCMVLSDYEAEVIKVELVPIRIGNADDNWYVIDTTPQIGEKRPRGTEIEIESQEAPPPGCEGPPQPVLVPDLVCKAPSDAQGILSQLGLLWQTVGQSDDPYVISQEPAAGSTLEPGLTVTGTTGVAGEECGCKVENPVDWLLCNLWVLLLLLGLVIARMWWIRREIEVSLNGQSSVGLGGGPWNGFDVYSGDARMNLNPRADSIQVHRSFFRSARYEDRRQTAAESKKEPLRMDEEIALADGVRFTVGYGSGGSDSISSGDGFTSDSSSRTSGSGSSGSSSKELEW
jgi:hypothetical protein